MSDISSMTREQAVDILAHLELKALTREQRLDHLDVLSCEYSSRLTGDTDSEDDDEWDLNYQSCVSEDVRREIDKGKFTDVMDARFDLAILQSVKFGFRKYSNNYLRRALKAFGHLAKEVVGKELRHIPCPACGADTLDKRGGYDICDVCWWEDDGLDNETINQ